MKLVALLTPKSVPLQYKEYVRETFLNKQKTLLWQTVKKQKNENRVYGCQNRCLLGLPDPTPMKRSKGEREEGIPEPINGERPHKI